MWAQREGNRKVHVPGPMSGENFPIRFHETLSQVMCNNHTEMRKQILNLEIFQGAKICGNQF